MRAMRPEKVGNFLHEAAFLGQKFRKEILS